MMTDDAPRPALDAATIEEGRRLLAALTPGPYSLSSEHSNLGYDIDPLPQGLRDGMDRVEDARAVLWLVQHADALLAVAAERDALAGEVARLRQLAGAALETLGQAECLASDAAGMAPMLSEDAAAWGEVLARIEEAMGTLERCAALAAEVQEGKAMVAPASPTRAFVERFAALMERKLAENRHKGDRAGWLKDDPIALWRRLGEEAWEIRAAIRHGAPPEEIARECADVANFAMFIADKFGALDEPEGAALAPASEPEAGDG